MAIVNFYSWVIVFILYVVILLVFVFAGTRIVRAACEEQSTSTEDCDDLTGIVWFIVGFMAIVGCPLLYLTTMVAYYYVAEK